MDELAKPADVVLARIAGLQHRWQRLKQRVERFGIAGEIAADQLGRCRSPIHEINVEGKVTGLGNVDHIRGRRIRAHPGAARHHVRVGVGEHHDFTGLERYRLPALEAGKTAASDHNMIGDEMVGARQDSREDQMARGRMNRPRLLRGDIEKRSAGEAHGL